MSILRSYIDEIDFYSLGLNLDFLLFFMLGLIYQYCKLKMLLKKYHVLRHEEVKDNMKYFLIVEIIPIAFYTVSRLVMVAI